MRTLLFLLLMCCTLHAQPKPQLLDWPIGASGISDINVGGGVRYAIDRRIMYRSVGQGAWKRCGQLPDNLISTIMRANGANVILHQKTGPRTFVYRSTDSCMTWQLVAQATLPQHFAGATDSSIITVMACVTDIDSTVIRELDFRGNLLNFYNLPCTQNELIAVCNATGSYFIGPRYQTGLIFDVFKEQSVNIAAEAMLIEGGQNTPAIYKPLTDTIEAYGTLRFTFQIPNGAVLQSFSCENSNAIITLGNNTLITTDLGVQWVALTAREHPYFSVAQPKALLAEHKGFYCSMPDMGLLFVTRQGIVQVEQQSAGMNSANRQNGMVQHGNELIVGNTFSENSTKVLIANNNAPHTNYRLLNSPQYSSRLFVQADSVWMLSDSIYHLNIAENILTPVTIVSNDNSFTRFDNKLWLQNTTRMRYKEDTSDVVTILPSGKLAGIAIVTDGEALYAMRSEMSVEGYGTEYLVSRTIGANAPEQYYVFTVQEQQTYYGGFAVANQNIVAILQKKPYIATPNAPAVVIDVPYELGINGSLIRRFTNADSELLGFCIPCASSGKQGVCVANTEARTWYYQQIDIPDEAPIVDAAVVGENIYVSTRAGIYVVQRIVESVLEGTITAGHVIAPYPAVRITLYNMQGIAVSTCTDCTLQDFRYFALPLGVYVAQVYNENSTHTQRILIER